MTAAVQQHNILLESGTNELEVLVFSLNDQRFGVNVAKVREVIEPTTFTKLPESHESVMGVFRLRDVVTPLIDLRRALHWGESDPSKGKIIIMEFNDRRVAFLVDGVEQIYRVRWESVSAMPEMDGVKEAPLTSIAHIKEQMVLMLDFERIVFDIGGVDLFAENSRRVRNERGRNDCKILLAEDSHTMRTLIKSNLDQAGYHEVTLCQDGGEALDLLMRNVQETGGPGFDLIITDIEMPRVDGLHLTRRIREDERMRDVPVVIFSSLVSADNEKKCKAVGANAQITKPQLGQLVDLLDNLLFGGPVGPENGSTNA